MEGWGLQKHKQHLHLKSPQTQHLKGEHRDLSAWCQSREVERKRGKPQEPQGDTGLWVWATHHRNKR